MDALYVSKTVKNTSLLRKLFDSLCLEKNNKAHRVILFSPTRWTNINLMFQRLLQSHSVLPYLPFDLLQERTKSSIDEEFSISSL